HVAREQTQARDASRLLVAVIVRVLVVRIVGGAGDARGEVGGGEQEQEREKGVGKSSVAHGTLLKCRDWTGREYLLVSASGRSRGSRNFFSFTREEKI